jgi:hypothetical protein
VIEVWGAVQGSSRPDRRQCRSRVPLRNLIRCVERTRAGLGDRKQGRTEEGGSAYDAALKEFKKTGAGLRRHTILACSPASIAPQLTAEPQPGHERARLRCRRLKCASRGGYRAPSHHCARCDEERLGSGAICNMGRQAKQVLGVASQTVTRFGRLRVRGRINRSQVPSRFQLTDIFSPIRLNGRFCQVNAVVMALAKESGDDSLVRERCIGVASGPKSIGL